MHLGLERGREIRGIFAAEGGENPTNFYFFFTPRYMKRDVSVNQPSGFEIYTRRFRLNVNANFIVKNGNLVFQ